MRDTDTPDGREHIVRNQVRRGGHSRMNFQNGRACARDRGGRQDGEVFAARRVFALNGENHAWRGSGGRGINDQDKSLALPVRKVA